MKRDDGKIEVEEINIGDLVEIYYSQGVRRANFFHGLVIKIYNRGGVKQNSVFSQVANVQWLEKNETTAHFVRHLSKVSR